MGWMGSLVPQRFAEGLVSPLIPVHAALLGAGAGLVGVMEFLFSGAAVAGALAWGRASDAAGRRKPFVLLGMVGAAAALAGLWYASTPLGVLAGRAAMGFALAAVVAAGGALAAESGSADGLPLRIGRLHAVSGLAYAGGLAAGAAAVLAVPLDRLMLAGALLTLASAALALRWIAEPGETLAGEAVLEAMRRTLTPVVTPFQQRALPPLTFLPLPHRGALGNRAWVYAASIFLAVWGGGIAAVLFPLFLLGQGAPLHWVPLVFLASVGAGSLVAGPGARLVTAWGPGRVHVAATVLRAGAFGALALPGILRLPVLLPLFAAAGLGWGLVSVAGPVALFRSFPDRGGGEVVGIFNAAAGLGAALGGLTAGALLLVGGYDGVFLAAAGVSLGSAVLGGPGSLMRGGG